MREDVLAGLELAAWAPAAASFIFGVGIGWLIFGGRRSDETGPGAAPPLEAGATADPGALDALQSQIKTARDLIDETDGEIDEFAEQLNTLDASLKRAHARLKSLFQIVRRGQDR